LAACIAAEIVFVFTIVRLSHPSRQPIHKWAAIERYMT
jgi:hypothetical protein